MKRIGFGTLTRYMIFPLLIPIFNCLYYYVLNIMRTRLSLRSHPFVITFFMFLSEMLGGSLELVSIYLRKTMRYKTRITKMLTNGIQPVLFKMNYDSICDRYIFPLLLLGIIFDFTAMTVLMAIVLNDDIYNHQNSFIGFQLIFTSLLSYSILKYPLYKHKLFSLGLTSIGIVLILIKVIMTISDSDEYIDILIIIGCFVLWSISEVIDKKIMESKLVSPYLVIFFYGFIGSILCLILFIPLYYIPCTQGEWFCNDSKIEDFPSTMSQLSNNLKTWVNIIIFITVFIVGALYNIVMILTNSLFNPAQVRASETLSSLIIWISDEISASEHQYLFLPIIGYLLMIIGAIIYNEIVILYCCSFEVYTKKEITLRSKYEQLDNKITKVDINFRSENNNKILEIDEIGSLSLIINSI